MSLPERQSEYSEYSRADTYSRLDTLMCLRNVQILLSEAKTLGALATISTTEVELDMDITDGTIRSSNILNQPIMQFETVNFYGLEDTALDAYRVRHNTEIVVQGMDRQLLAKEYWLFYEKPEEDKMPVFDAVKSRYKIGLEMAGKSEAVRILPNEGYPLQPLEHLSFENSVNDFGRFNGYQFLQIEQLAIRALDGVRAI